MLTLIANEIVPIGLELELVSMLTLIADIDCLRACVPEDIDS